MYVLLPSLEKSTKSLEGIGKLVLSAVKQAAAAMLGGLTQGDNDAQMKREERTKRAKPPFFVIPDEYGSYAIKGFSDVLAQARSLGVGVMISIQEKASLEKAGKEEAERILGNTRFKIALNIEDLETKKYMVEQAAKVHAFVKSSEHEDKFQVYDQYLKTEEQYSLQEVEVISLRELGEFGPGEGIFLFYSKLRRFLTPYYEPKKATKIELNRLYPTVRIELAKDDPVETQLETIEEDNDTESVFY
jgi:type IV secretory pathway TraG/TraD family ATPase VirD4